MTEKTTARGFRYGLRRGTAIAIGYIPSALACGILCKTAGLTAFESLFMSVIVFAGASQFVALNLLMVGAAIPEIVLATAVLNARHIILSSAIAPRLEHGTGALQKLIIGAGVTDESFSVAAMQPEDILAPDFMYGLNLPGYFAWWSGTLAGYIGTAFLPQGVQDSMGIAIYALFIGLLVPGIRKNRAALTVAAIAMALSAYIKWTPCLASMNKGIAVMLTTGAAAAFGAVVFPLGRKRAQ